MWIIKISFLMFCTFFHVYCVYYLIAKFVLLMHQVLVTGSIHLVGDVLKLIKKWFVGLNWKLCLFSDFKVMKCHYYFRWDRMRYSCLSRLIVSWVVPKLLIECYQHKNILAFGPGYIGLYKHQPVCLRGIFQSSWHSS